MVRVNVMRVAGLEVTVGTGKKADMPAAKRKGKYTLAQEVIFKEVEALKGDEYKSYTFPNRENAKRFYWNTHHIIVREKKPFGISMHDCTVNIFKEDLTEDKH